MIGFIKNIFYIFGDDYKNKSIHEYSSRELIYEMLTLFL